MCCRQIVFRIAFIFKRAPLLSKIPGFTHYYAHRVVNRRNILLIDSAEVFPESCQTSKVFGRVLNTPLL